MQKGRGAVLSKESQLSRPRKLPAVRHCLRRYRVDKLDQVREIHLRFPGSGVNLCSKAGLVETVTDCGWSHCHPRFLDGGERIKDRPFVVLGGFFGVNKGLLDEFMSVVGFAA